MKIMKKSLALFFVAICMASTVSVGTLVKTSDPDTYRSPLSGDGLLMHANGFDFVAGALDGLTGLEAWTHGVSSGRVLEIYDSLAGDFPPADEESDALATESFSPNVRRPARTAGGQYQNILAFVDGGGSIGGPSNLAHGNTRGDGATSTGFAGNGRYTVGDYAHNSPMPGSSTSGRPPSGGQALGDLTLGAPAENNGGTTEKGATTPPGTPEIPRIPNDQVFDDRISPEEIVVNSITPPIPKADTDTRANNGNKVPEPGSIALLGLGLLGLAAARRRSSEK